MQNILDHFKHPENYGELEGATVVREEFNAMCGDKIKLYLKIKDGVITQVSFTGTGCAISQAAMSILSTELVGMTIEDVKKIRKEDIQEMLNIELSPTRLKCALLGWQALQNAIRAIVQG